MLPKVRMARAVSRGETVKAESRSENEKEENGNFPFDVSLAYIAQHVILFRLFRNLACYQL